MYNMISTDYDTYINLNDFNKGTQFNEKIQLHEYVNSDHSAIGCILKYENDRQINIGAVNISNKEYHPYFGLSKDAPFINTHMFVPKNCEDKVKNDWLISKTETQMNNIVRELTENVIDILIIVEGYFDFFTKLDIELKKAGDNFQIISILNKENHGYEGKNSNITGIVIRKRKFEIDVSDTIVQTYTESQDPNIHKYSTLTVPFVRVRDINSNKFLTVIGVHLPGCNSQFPKNALCELRTITKSLFEKYKNDIVALGDYNTIPNNIRKIMTDIDVLTPLFPTHINPNCDVVAYDNVSYILSKNDAKSIELMNIYTIPLDSFALVTSLIANRKLVYETKG